MRMISPGPIFERVPRMERRHRVFRGPGDPRTVVRFRYICRIGRAGDALPARRSPLMREQSRDNGFTVVFGRVDWNEGCGSSRGSGPARENSGHAIVTGTCPRRTVTPFRNAWRCTAWPQTSIAIPLTSRFLPLTGSFVPARRPRVGTGKPSPRRSTGSGGVRRRPTRRNAGAGRCGSPTGSEDRPPMCFSSRNPADLSHGRQFVAVRRPVAPRDEACGRTDP